MLQKSVKKKSFPFVVCLDFSAWFLFVVAILLFSDVDQIYLGACLASTLTLNYSPSSLILGICLFSRFTSSQVGMSWRSPKACLLSLCGPHVGEVVTRLFTQLSRNSRNTRNIWKALLHVSPRTDIASLLYPTPIKGEKEWCTSINDLRGHLRPVLELSNHHHSITKNSSHLHLAHTL